MRPRLEALEDRVTPTVFAPTVFTDGMAGGTLREAVINANNDMGPATDTIQLAAGTYTLSIANVGGSHDVSNSQGDLNVTSTAHALVIQGATDASGNPTSIINQTAADRVFQIVNPGTTVSFRDLIIEGGNAQDDGGAGTVAGSSVAQGGGILDDGGDVTLSNVVVRSNQATAGDTFFAQGGGIYAQDGTLTINHSVIRNNTAAGGAGAAGANGGNADGGGVCYVVTGPAGPQLSMTNSTVTDNVALGGAGPNVAGTEGGEADGGGVYTLGAATTTITASTLSDNAVYGGKVGIGGGQDGFAAGGGAYLEGIDTVVNSTIADNGASGAGAAGGGVYFGAAATGEFTNVTVATNEARATVGTSEGGGLDNNNGAVKPVNLVNTVVAGNLLNMLINSSGADVRGAFASGGHNLIGVADGANDPGFHAPGDLTGSAASPLDAGLGLLSDNGGPTQTLLPSAGSPVLGAGDAGLAPSTDQRGQLRPPGGPTDLGAVQVSLAPTSPPGSPPPGSPPPGSPPPSLLQAVLGLYVAEVEKDIGFGDPRAIQQAIDLNARFTVVFGVNIAGLIEQIADTNVANARAGGS